MIYVTASIPKGCVQYWHTQPPCTQGSELCDPNSCAPIIVYLAALYTSSDIGLVYPGLIWHKICNTASVPNESKFFHSLPNFLVPKATRPTHRRPMQICIHRKDNSPKPANHCLTLKEGPKVKSNIRKFLA